MKPRSDRTFDAVQMMRQIRDRLSRQIKDMDFEQEQHFIEERLRDSPFENSTAAAREGDQ